LIDETPIESLVVFYSLCLKRLQFCTQIEQTMFKLKTVEISRKEVTCEL
jgi:hypothetical protein